MGLGGKYVGTNFLFVQKLSPRLEYLHTLTKIRKAAILKKITGNDEGKILLQVDIWLTQKVLFEAGQHHPMTRRRPGGGEWAVMGQHFTFSVLSGDVLTPGLIWTSVTVRLRLWEEWVQGICDWVGSENSDIILDYCHHHQSSRYLVCPIIFVSLNVSRFHAKQNCVLDLICECEWIPPSSLIMIMMLASHLTLGRLQSCLLWPEAKMVMAPLVHYADLLQTFAEQNNMLMTRIFIWFNWNKTFQILKSPLEQISCLRQRENLFMKRIKKRLFTHPVQTQNWIEGSLIGFQISFVSLLNLIWILSL